MVVAIGASIGNNAAIQLSSTRTPAGFARYVSQGRWVPYPHLLVLDRAIMDTLRGKDGIRRLIVTMPPQHGKSELICKYTPAWYLGTFPDRRIILVGYGTDFASEWGGKARDVLKAHGQSVFGVKVQTDTTAAAHWKIAGRDAEMHSAGLVGGDITGRSANLFIIDDPIKTPKEAASEVYRNATYDSYIAAATTRLQKDGAIILVQTRWHSDDLAGRLLKNMADGGQSWRVVTMPAIDESGNALCEALHPIKELIETRDRSGMSGYFWSALYMQRPTPRSGGMFKTDRIQIVQAAPALLKRICRAWDIASTADGGDFTAGAKLGVDSDGVYYILDMERGQWDTDTRDRRILQTAEVDGHHVSICGPQDPGSAGKDFALFFARKLAGFNVKTAPVSSNKSLRADPFSAQVNAGNVRMVAGPFNRALLEEMGSFPFGAHDDQIDCMSDAFAGLTKKRTVMVA